MHSAEDILLNELLYRRGNNFPRENKTNEVFILLSAICKRTDYFARSYERSYIYVSQHKVLFYFKLLNF